MRIIICTALISGVALASYGAAGDSDSDARLKVLDRNRDGKLQTAEIDLGILNVMKEGKIDFSLPLSTDAMKETITAMSPSERHTFTLNRALFNRVHGEHDEYEFSKIDAQKEFLLPAPKKPDQPPTDKLPPKVVIRRNLEKMPPGFALADPVTEDLKKNPDKLNAAGALFSFGQANSGAKEVIIEGLVSYEVPSVRTSASGEFTAYDRDIFSVGFNRVQFKGDEVPTAVSPRFKKESNFAQFGYTRERALSWPRSAASGSTGSALRVNLLFTTDWSFDSQIPSVELEWSPFNGRFGLNQYNTLSDRLWWQIAATIHADYGWVRADGNWTKSTAGDTFAHVGPKLGAKLQPFPLSEAMRDHPLTFDVSFAQYEKLTDDAKLVRNFSATLAWFITKPGKGLLNPGVAFILNYQNLKNVENKTDDDTWFAGLAFGY